MHDFSTLPFKKLSASFCIAVKMPIFMLPPRCQEFVLFKHFTIVVQNSKELQQQKQVLALFAFKFAKQLCNKQRRLLYAAPFEKHRSKKQPPRSNNVQIRRNRPLFSQHRQDVLKQLKLLLYILKNTLLFQMKFVTIMGGERNENLG